MHVERRRASSCTLLCLFHDSVQANLDFRFRWLRLAVSLLYYNGFRKFVVMIMMMVIRAELNTADSEDGLVLDSSSHLVYVFYTRLD